MGRKETNIYSKNEETIRELLALGDISSLGNKPLISRCLGKFSTASPDECVSYKMRGETDVDSTTTNNLDSYVQAGIHSGVEYLYVYVMAEKEWKYRYIYEIMGLGEVFKKICLY